MAVDFSGLCAYLPSMIARLLTLFAIVSIAVGMTVRSSHATRVGGVMVGQSHHGHTFAVGQAAADSRSCCKGTPAQGSGHDYLCQIMCAGGSVAPAAVDAGAVVMLTASWHDPRPEAWHVGRSPGPDDRPPKHRLI